MRLNLQICDKDSCKKTDYNACAKDNKKQMTLQHSNQNTNQSTTGHFTTQPITQNIQ